MFLFRRHLLFVDGISSELDEKYAVEDGNLTSIKVTVLKHVLGIFLN